ncbi:hypothetical protein B1A_13248, partial [mine drainage metagenome]
MGAVFGSELTGFAGTNDILSWNRAQQAAFLILVWRAVEEALSHYTGGWADELRRLYGVGHDGDPAWSGEFTLLATDQGVRGILSVMNDLCYVTAEENQMRHLPWTTTSDHTTEDTTISAELDCLLAHPVAIF